MLHHPAEPEENDGPPDLDADCGLDHSAKAYHELDAVASELRAKVIELTIENARLQTRIVKLEAEE